MFDSLINGAFNIGTTALQNKYNQQMQNAQNAYNLQMWNLQNEYNSPTSQMQRFKEAGLNPNLIYGSGVSSGNASHMAVMQAPQKNAPQLEMGGLLQDVLSIFDIKKAALDLKNYEEEIRGNRIKNTTNMHMLDLLLGKKQAMQSYGNPYESGPDIVWNQLESFYRKKFDLDFNQQTENIHKTKYQSGLFNQQAQLTDKKVKYFLYNAILDGVNTAGGLINPIGRLFKKAPVINKTFNYSFKK